MNKTIGRIITSLAMLYALNTGLDAQVIDTAKDMPKSVATETSITPSGVPIHGTNLNVGPLTVRHEVNKTDITGVFLDNIVQKENFFVNGAILNVGNYDGKDEAFLDITSRANYNDVTYGLEGGSSLRKTSVPRQFAIATIENLPVKQGIKTSLEGALITKDPLSDQKENQYYGWIAAYDDKMFASTSYAAGDKQVFTGINTKDFGQFTWYKNNATGGWQIKTRTSFGNVDEKFYSSGSQINTTRLFTIPQFYDIHLKPSQTRGDYTLGFDITSCTKETITKIVPGVKTLVGYIGFGAESNSTITGIYGSYYNNFDVLGMKGSVEANYNGRTKDVSGYVTVNAELNK